ncbi:MAG TPA: carboxy terminal-processing peptidase [Candidatus Acidoferrales bacterium]|nr:carboxy terminal-processing peptidase [Candidatus Acidoferrales bacterium]
MRLLTAVAGLGLAIMLLTAATLGNRPVSPVDAGATEANITRVTAGLLAQSQFSHHPLDAELAGKFLDGYLDALDGDHVLFLGSDLKDFDAFRGTLAEDTRQAGNTHPAEVIFERLLKRLQQRVNFVTNALRAEKFNFNGHDVYAYDRTDAPRPADLAAAKKLWWQQLRADYLQEKLDGKTPAEIVKTLSDRYQQQFKSMKELDRNDVLDIYLNALAHVYDPHSDYLSHEELQSFDIAMNLSLFGIGAELESNDGYCTIRSLVAGGPAARSGLLNPGDRIVAVAQAGKSPVDVESMPLTHLVELIRGPKGSSVRLTIIPADAAESVRKTVTLVREEIKLEDEEASARIMDWPPEGGRTLRLGVIDLPSFYTDMQGWHGDGHRSASADVAKLLRKLKAENVGGVILDLRQNGGGSLEEAIDVAGLFLPRGPVVQTRGPDGDMQIGTSDNAKALYTGPLIVLTSRFSASASEIVAGALQDYGRAVIVGDPTTFGKGTVQNIVQLAPILNHCHLGYAYDPGALKVTIRKFYRPSGASTQLKGVASDIVLPSLSDLSGVSESALKDPLPWDTVPAVDYHPLNLVEPYLARLRADSARRVAREKGFVYLQDDIALLKKNSSTKTVSLNEAERRSEMAQAKALQTDLDQESLALAETAPRTYDLTLKNAAKPGLPPPITFTNFVAATRTGKLTAHKNGSDISLTERSTPQDIILTETEHILADYAGLFCRPDTTVPCNGTTGRKQRPSSPSATEYRGPAHGPSTSIVLRKANDKRLES